MPPWTALLDLVLPPVCAGCRTGIHRDSILCPRCNARLPRTGGAPFVPARLTACVAAVRYEGDAREWVRRFKQPAAGILSLDVSALAVARFLILEAAARAPGHPPELVIPIPPHPRSLRTRAFHAAGRLARSVARAHGVPMATRALVAQRPIRSQTGLGRAARLRNVRGAFAAPRPLPERIWLVDDVMTTGSTLSEAARAARRAGAREVVGLCIAATPPVREA